MRSDRSAAERFPAARAVPREFRTGPCRAIAAPWLKPSVNGGDVRFVVHSRRFARVVSISLGLLGLPSLAAAAPGEALRQGAAVNGHVATESSQVLPKWTPSAALATTYLRQVGASQPGDLAIDARLQSHLGLAFGIAGWAQLDASLPVTIHQRGQTYEQGSFVELPSAALGDVRLGAKGTLLRTPRRGFGLGVLFDATLPSGSGSALTSHGGPTFTPALAAEYRFARGVLVSANAGYAVRPEVNVANELGGDAVVYRVAARIPVAPREQFALFGELDGAASMLQGAGTPLAARGGFRWSTRGGLVMSLWGGGAVVDALGLPTLQLGLTAAFAPVRRTKTDPAFRDNERTSAVALARGYDRTLATLSIQPKDEIERPDDPDGDGILAQADLCPSVPEDLDGMQDGDGCPELDDDRDGLRDAVDLCPRAPEIINGYRDLDGCPDRRLANGGGQTFASFDARRFLPPLHFAEGSADIDPAMAAELDTLAELLRLNPWIERLQLSVFVPQTDDDGKDRALADARSAALRQALETRGVAAWRVEALPAKAVAAGSDARVRLTLSGRARALDPVAPRPETLDRMITDAARELATETPDTMAAQGPPADDDAR